ncbi:MAG TPA: XdhC/CoxI family protein, partial [Bacillota bacterium]
CLEDDVREAARRTLASGEPELLLYDMTADDDIVWGLGLGCNGTVNVFVERLDPKDQDPRIDAPAGRRERVAVATVVRDSQAAGTPAVGSRIYVYADRVEGSLGDPDLDALVAADARDLLARGASRSYLYTYRNGRPDPGAVVRERKQVLQPGSEHVQVYIESFAPPPTLLIFGAGHDAIPMARVGREAGFRVVVVDSRRAYATRERFPDAEEVVHAHADEALDHVTIDRFTHVVVMTHNFNRDHEILRAIWGQPYAYLGMLGPWERTSLLLDALRGDGCDVDAHLDRLYGPIGLDIGAEGPEQIALAVVAEILAVRNGKPAGFLRFRKGPIHEMQPSA